MKTVKIKEALENGEEYDEGMISKNPPPKLHILLNQYLDEKGLTKADVIRRLNVDRNYGYQVFNGKRIPTRNILIQLSLMLGLDIEQTDYLLRLADKPMLYVRNPVDARVFYSIKHGFSFEKAVPFIWEGKEE